VESLLQDIRIAGGRQTGSHLATGEKDLDGAQPSQLPRALRQLQGCVAEVQGTRQDLVEQQHHPPLTAGLCQFGDRCGLPIDKGFDPAGNLIGHDLARRIQGFQLDLMTARTDFDSRLASEQACP